LPWQVKLKKKTTMTRYTAWTLVLLTGIWLLTACKKDKDVAPSVVDRGIVSSNASKNRFDYISGRSNYSSAKFYNVGHVADLISYYNGITLYRDAWGMSSLVDVNTGDVLYTGYYYIEAPGAPILIYKDMALIHERVGTGDARLIMMKIDDKSIVWERSTPGLFSLRGVVGKYAIGNSNGDCYIIDLDNGQGMRVPEINAFTNYFVSNYNSFAVLKAYDNEILFYSSDGTLKKRVVLSDKIELWIGEYFSSAYKDLALIVVGVSNLSFKMFALDMKQEKVLWEKTLSQDKRYVSFSNDDRYAYALLYKKQEGKYYLELSDIKTGELVETLAVPDGILPTNWISGGYRISLNPLMLRNYWMFFYVKEGTAYIRAFDKASRQWKQWTVTLPVNVLSFDAITLDEKGRIYIDCEGYNGFVMIE
jgi:hypothetical protein